MNLIPILLEFNANVTFGSEEVKKGLGDGNVVFESKVQGGGKVDVPVALGFEISGEALVDLMDGSKKCEGGWRVRDYNEGEREIH